MYRLGLLKLVFLTVNYKPYFTSLLLRSPYRKVSIVADGLCIKLFGRVL
nr:MAG TPA: hypothetical protein [Caudoviricetes sp.]